MKIRTATLAVGVLLFGLTAIAADIPRPEHPTPQSVRPHWANLNGTWEFRFDPDDQGVEGEWFKPGAEGFDKTITVPFPWESELSGIHRPKNAPKVAWYRRTFTVPEDFPKENTVRLHFGAVDYEATVWVDGYELGKHEGGYTPFSFDLRPVLQKQNPGTHTVVVRAFDPTDPQLPVGKQVGWYTTTSGIWQTVWIESVPRVSIDDFTIRTDVDPARATITLLASPTANDGKFTVGARSDDASLTTESKPLVTPDVRAGSDSKDVRSRASATIEIPVRDPKLWSPDSPHLYNVTLELKDNDGKVVDSIDTYFGLRTIARGKVGNEPFERILLNGKPIYLRGALDQSFNPKGIYTAPTDEFLKRDIELAKEAGTNFLRIHIKPDEPRRLYWADKLGMLIMEDMPNSWEHTERTKETWESTLRGTIARDKNHPSIFAWVDFNETWGVAVPDTEGYKKNRAVQEWVGKMVKLTRELDPTRLVEDMSPCNYDHITDTDLNSWHFYIDDHREARRHIEEVVAKTFPGSEFNHVPGQKTNDAPLINSEYGSVSAGGGDRDVSWGFRDLTTQLRRHPKIQGYIYTELSDIEWEHNGFYDYDRSKKEFGYDAFVPGMTVADLQGADFIGYDAPPAIVAKPGEIVRVPVFLSHYSDRTEAPTLKWWITGTDDYGNPDSSPPREREVTWTPYGVTEQKPLAFRVKGPFVGAVAMVLQDKSGEKIAANFVNVVVKADAPQARVERLGDHQVALRFKPEDYASEDWSGPVGGVGKAYGQGTGEFTYRLKVPESVAKAKPVSVQFLLEASSKAGREKVDFADRKNPQDYPQTDAQKWPSTLTVSLNGTPAVGTDLADDPADARGVLSHVNRVEHGSHGELIRLDVPLTEEVRADIAAGKSLVVSIGTPDDAKEIGGLALFGENTGAYPFDPTVTITTEADLPEDLGVKADAPVAIDSLASRKVSLLRAGDSNQGRPTVWSYTTDDPGANWQAGDFDASAWKSGPGGFGSAQTPALQEHTGWHSNAIWLRTTIEAPKVAEDDTMTLHLFHDEDVQIFVNGQPLFSAGGYSTDYQDVVLTSAQKALFREGKNIIAVHCTQSSGGQGVDLGLSLLKAE